MSSATEEVFAAVYREHVAQVRAIAGRRVRRDDQDLIEDLVQEAFLRYWRHLQAGKPVTNPVGLLGTMVVHAAAEHYRLCRNTREGATDFTDPLAARCVPAAPSAEEVALMHVEIERLLADAVTGVSA